MRKARLAGIDNKYSLPVFTSSSTLSHIDGARRTPIGHCLSKCQPGKVVIGDKFADPKYRTLYDFNRFQI